VSFLSQIRDFSRPHWMDIVFLLKRTQGMPVAELAREMEMSYMGVKQHCVEMERLGYLDTWRHPSKMGRPQKFYRLTDKAQGLFPDVGKELSLDLLELVGTTYGSTAPEKLLLGYFAKKKEGYAKRVRGETAAEKAASLAKLRSEEGYLSQCLYDSKGGLRIVEYHSPLRHLAEAYPGVYVMEVQMFGELIGDRVTRTVEEASGLHEYLFRVGTISSSS